MEDIDGFLKPTLKIINGWNGQQLEDWCKKEAAIFGVTAKFEPYQSGAGRRLEHIFFFVNNPDERFSGLYFTDEGDWQIQHNQTDLGRKVTHLIYKQLIDQKIAITLSEWINKTLNQETKKKRRMGRPPLKTASL